MAMDWDEIRQPAGERIVVGEQLDRLSVGELEARITALTAEIERVRAELDRKKAHEQAADQLFRSR
jgi:uncharacterized small protein (DUF1192 family)